MSEISLSARELLQSWYNYSRLPLWFYDESGSLLDCFVREQDPDMKTLLADTVKRIVPQKEWPDYHTVIQDNELYILFPCRPDLYEKTVLAVIGPLLLTPCFTIFEMRQLSFARGLSSEDLSSLVSRLHVLEYSRADGALQFVTRLLNACSIPSMRSALSDILNRLQLQRDDESLENPIAHTSYRDELAVLECVRDGDLARLESTYRAQPEIQYGSMSSNPLRQMVYAIIANITLVTRFAIQGGMPEEPAFRLSDQYIQRIERCRTVPELLRLNEEMGVDFTSRVAEFKLKSSPELSPPIRKCIEIITHDPRSPHPLDSLASEVGLSPKYLSARFRKETNTNLHEYLEQQRILEAERLLLYTSRTISEISPLLHFSSQSYFSSVFKKYTGLTPREYRNRHKK